MKLCNTATCVVVLLLATAGDARAQSAQTKRLLRNGEGAIASIKVDPEFKKGVIGKRDFEARTALKDLENGLKRARSSLTDVPEADRSLPAVTALEAKVKELEEYRDVLAKALSGQQADEAAAKERHFAFLKEFDSCKQSILTLGDLLGNQDKNVIASKTPKDLQKMLDDLALIAKGCEEKYKGIANHPKYSVNLETSPGTWRELAAVRDKLAARAVVNRITQDVQLPARQLKELVAELEKREGWIALSTWALVHTDEWKTKFLASADEWFAVLQKPRPENLLAGWDQLVAKARETIDQVAPKLAFPTGVHDERIEGVARKQIQGAFPKAEILQSVMVKDEWIIEVNALKVPVKRSRTGHVLFRLPGEKWAQQRTFNYVEQYAGGGNYQPADSAAFLEMVRFLEAK